MSSLIIIVAAVVAFLIAYVTYGSYLAKKWGIDPNRETPAHYMNDGVDYVPAPAPVLLGHHFSSIAGAGPIVGPIAAATFGWLPVFLWIVIGSIFFGGTHDMGSLFASVRHDGKSLGETIGITIGKKGKLMFAVFAWLTLILVIAAFINVVAGTFVSNPEVATASILFIFLAIGFGITVYRQGVSLLIGTVIGVALLVVAIWLGLRYPIVASREVWMFILVGYIFVASVTPVWILLQPRDYLNSFLLYAMLIGGFFGLVFMNPSLQLAPVTSFNTSTGPMFPMLFVVVACGAISGFHSLVGSGTTSKQLNSEKDVKLVGYGAMLIEGVLATLAVLSAAYIGADKLGELLGAGGPVNVFSQGIGTFMTSLGIPLEVGSSFTALAISAFALTSLDTGTRLGRFLFQEIASSINEDANPNTGLSNMYISTFITVAIGGSLAFKGWAAVWPIFGSANQLLSALALLAVGLWMKKSGRKYKMATYPMIFMFAVTLTALVILMMNNFGDVLFFFAAALFILALLLMKMAYTEFTNTEFIEGKESKEA